MSEKDKQRKKYYMKKYKKEKSFKQCIKESKRKQKGGKL